ncbi:Alcohol dehydrogenase N-terminal domain-containing protein [Mesobacillus zeae]
MKAVTFQGAKDIQVRNVQDPVLQKKDDIIVRITSTAICGSDLHIYLGAMPARPGYVIGHEPMGIVEEVGPEVTKVKKATGSSFHLMFPAANAFSASMKWKASVTIPIRTRQRILAVI